MANEMTIPQVAPNQLMVRVVECDRNVAKLVLQPRWGAVEELLTAAFGPMGWASRRYGVNGVNYCAVGVRDPRSMEMVYRDAPARSDYIGTPESRIAISGLYHAAAQWGVCADVEAMPAMVIGDDQLRIVPVAGKDGKTIVGYRVDSRLTVDEIGRDEAGNIVAVQLVADGSKKVVWQR